MGNDVNKFIDREIYNDIMSGTNIISGDEFKTIMCTIAQLCSDLVVKTLGPYGSTTLLDDGMGAVYPTKDGWSVLCKMKFNDPIYNTALNTLRKTSFDAVTAVGDGTTTAMVAANAFLQFIITQKLDKDPEFDQALFRKSVEAAADDIINTLYKFTTPIEANEQGYKVIRQIAKVATNGNDKFADLVSEIYQKTNNPTIHVQIGNTPETKYTIEDGYKVDAVPIMHSAYINADEKKSFVKNGKVLILNHNMTYVNHWDMLRVLADYTNAYHQPVVIMAPYFDDSICTWMVKQAQEYQRVGAIPYLRMLQIPFTTELQKLAIEDLEIMTNASVIDDAKLRMYNAMLQREWIAAGKIDPETRYDTAMAEMGVDTYQTSSNLVLKSLGNLATLEVTDKQIFLRDFEETADIARLEQARKVAEDTWNHVNKRANRQGVGSIDKEYITAHQRYIRLRGKMGIIEVGGVTDLQKMCDKDSLDDACLACRSAWDSGYISGMGFDTLRITNAHMNYFKHAMKIDTNPDQKRNKYYMLALRAIYRAFNTVAQYVLHNKSASDKVVSFPDRDDTMKLTNNQIIEIGVLGTLWDSADKEFNDPVYLHQDTVDSLYFTDPEWKNTLKRICFDAKNDRFLCMDHEDAIINSVEIDVQIIRTMVSVLTMVITSNQFLSTGRMYDRKLTRSQSLQNLSTEERTKGMSFMDGVFEAIRASKNEDALAKLGTHLSANVHLGETNETKASPMNDSMGGALGSMLGMLGGAFNQPKPPVIRSSQTPDTISEDDASTDIIYEQTPDGPITYDPATDSFTGQ